MGDVQWKRLADEQPEPNQWVWMCEYGKRPEQIWWSGTFPIADAGKLWTEIVAPPPPAPDTPELRLIARMIEAASGAAWRMTLEGWRTRLIEEARADVRTTDPVDPLPVSNPDDDTRGHQLSEID